MSLQSLVTAQADMGGGSGYSDDVYSFAVDASQIEDLCEFLTSKADDLQTAFDGIFSEIVAMESDAWSGTSYETFRTKCYEYKPAMDALVAIFRAYVSLYQKEVTDAKQILDETLDNAFANASDDREY